MHNLAIHCALHTVFYKQRHKLPYAWGLIMSKYPDLPPQHGVVVRTDRIYLRPVTPEDLSALHEIRMKPTVMQYM